MTVIFWRQSTGVLWVDGNEALGQEKSLAPLLASVVLICSSTWQ